MEPPRFTGFSITSADPHRALDFYRELGFDVKEDRHGGGRDCDQPSAMTLHDASDVLCDSAGTPPRVPAALTRIRIAGEVR